MGDHKAALRPEKKMPHVRRNLWGSTYHLQSRGDASFRRWLRSIIWVDSASRYDAFLSYSWKSDGKVAPVIQSVMQRFLCRWYKIRAKTLFRDLSCLPAGSNLKGELFDRLDRSTDLIVLASAEAAQSEGMEIEARYWFERERLGEVLIIVADGECKTWDQIRDHLLPATVRDKLASEPIWIPLQHRRHEILVDPNSQKLRGQLIEDLRQVFLRLYAPQTWEELQGEERAQRRRAIGITGAAALVFLGLAVAAIGFGIGEQRNARESKARELAAYSTQGLNEDPEKSILLGMQAVNATLRFGQPPLPAAEEALHQAILSSQVRVTLRDSLFVYAVAFSPDGKRLATGVWDGTAKVCDAQSGNELLTLHGHSGNVSAVAFSPDGRRLATASYDGTAKVWDAQSGNDLLTLRGHSNVVTAVAFSPDGKRLATASWDGTVVIGRSFITASDGTHIHLYGMICLERVAQPRCPDRRRGPSRC